MIFREKKNKINQSYILIEYNNLNSPFLSLHVLRKFRNKRKNIIL